MHNEEVPATVASTIEKYWQPSFETLYEACFHELTSERIIQSWSRVHLSSAFLAAIAASGSAVSGWTLWADPRGKILWGCIAAFASVLAIVHSVLGVPNRIKEEEQRRQQFSALRVDLETFRHSLTLHPDPASLTKVFENLRSRLRDYVSKAPPDIFLTPAQRQAVQRLVNEKLKKYIDA